MIHLTYKFQNMRHFAAAQHYHQHGPTLAVGPTKLDTELEGMQGLIYKALGEYLDMSRDIKKQLDTIVEAASNDPLIDQDAIDRVKSTVNQQLTRWSNTAMIAPMSHQEMIYHIHPDLIDRATITQPVESNQGHRALISALSLFIKVQGKADVAAVAQIMWDMMQAVLDTQGAARCTHYVAVAAMQLIFKKAANTDHARDAKLAALCTQLQTPPRCLRCGRYHDEVTCGYCGTMKPCFQGGIRKIHLLNSNLQF